jgi:ribosomal protein S18 acetylase RimI-like enzyme
MKIHHSLLTPKLKDQIYEEFSNAAIKATGINGIGEEPVSFERREGANVIACVVVQLFWAQLHIKYLFVQEQYRCLGIATELMQHAFNYGKSHNCTFAFVETMSFQAVEFYQKLGFNIEFSRGGYDKNSSLNYLKKNL